MAERILVVDDDPDIARFIEVNLRTQGYEVEVAADGLEALERAAAQRPDLALIDVMMPRLDGFEVVERLRANPRTSNMSIILLTAKALTADKVLGITKGADDYIIKPFDPVELMARVKGTLRRAQEMRAESPLTGLPGNIRILDFLGNLVSAGRPFALLYADLDHFKAYNDHYGFLRGDDALRFAARTIQETALDVCGDEVFVGHLGGDDFVVVCPPEAAERLSQEILDRTAREFPSLYDEEDRHRGHIEVENRQQQVERFPLLSVSIGVATTARRRFTHPSEVVAVATELKEYAKRTEGPSFAVDRRTVPEPPAG
ncbi:MAG TPA: response regulator [Actinomycetota bacterium]|nr:response regulator [Actinomycetota bacterium]